jgi:hypothetical protein
MDLFLILEYLKRTLPLKGVYDYALRVVMSAYNSLETVNYTVDLEKQFVFVYSALKYVFLWPVFIISYLLFTVSKWYFCL